MEEFKYRIQKLRKEIGLTQPELAKKLEVSNSTVGMWENGTRMPGRENMEAIADLFNVDIDYLYCRTDVRQQIHFDGDGNEYISLKSINNILEINTKKFPLLGEIACGKPIMARENRESYVESGTELNADFCLKCKGDSMIGARIQDGDIVFIRKQDTVNDGEIAAVIIRDKATDEYEATLKRVYYHDGVLQLCPENPKYKPLIYTKDSTDDARIIGKAIAFESDIK